MNLPPDMVQQIFSLPSQQRFELAQQLLDSIDAVSAGEFNDEFTAELERRRAEMLKGEEIVPDWREALAEIEASLSGEKPA